MRSAAQLGHCIADEAAGLVRKIAGLSFEGGASPEKSIIAEIFIEGLDSQVSVQHGPPVWC